MRTCCKVFRTEVIKAGPHRRGPLRVRAGGDGEGRRARAPARLPDLRGGDHLQRSHLRRGGRRSLEGRRDALAASSATTSRRGSASAARASPSGDERVGPAQVRRSLTSAEYASDSGHAPSGSIRHPPVPPITVTANQAWGRASGSARCFATTAPRLTFSVGVRSPLSVVNDSGRSDANARTSVSFEARRPLRDLLLEQRPHARVGQERASFAADAVRVAPTSGRGVDDEERATLCSLLSPHERLRDERAQAGLSSIGTGVTNFPFSTCTPRALDEEEPVLDGIARIPVESRRPPA